MISLDSKLNVLINHTLNHNIVSIYISRFIKPLDFISTMRFRSIQLFNGKHTTSGNTTNKSVILLPFVVLFIMFPFSLMKFSHQSSSSSSSPNKLLYATTAAASLNLSHIEIKRCNIFSGEWVPYGKGVPYYDNETCNLITDQQNCIKFGRPDREFLKWRWKPDECELPLFNATQFLRLVKGKSMAFLGDSVGRNQMNSLLCLLNHVSVLKSINHTISFSDF